jgi:hypothetical protein
MRPFLIFLACMALLWGALSVLAIYADATELSISSQATGQGYHEMEVLPDIENLTVEEATYLLGPGYNFNVSRYGLVTFENGSTWNLTAVIGV